MFVFVEVIVPYENIITANYDGTRNTAADTELFFFDLANGWVEMTGTTGGKTYPVKDTTNNTVTHLYVYETQADCTAVVKDASVTPFTEVTAANAIESQGLENKAVDMLVKAYAIQAENLAETQNETNPYKVWDIFMNQGTTVDAD